ncbi:MAG: 4-hydroxy-tetrahydrodipicolinate reductase [Actinomycetes bacterium]
MTIKVGVIGSAGRMGAEVIAALASADDLELVAAVDVDDDLNQLVAAGVQVAVDFTTPMTVMANLAFCIDHGINAVVGTSGFTPQRLTELREQLATHPDVGVLIAPNFGIAAVLMMSFAARAARFFDSAEIIEMHHPAKVDAPSGTARRTAELISQARSEAGCAPMPDATVDQVPGARGAEIEGVHVHAVRALGLIAHQEVVFGGPGEILTIRHDSMNRASFMPGVLLAVREVGSRPGLTVGLEHLLNLD